MIPHISFSQYSSFKDCPNAWRLGKQVKAEEVPTWFLPLGSAVHAMIEDYLKVEDPDDPHSALRPAEQYFYPLVAKQMEIEPDLSKWLAGGKRGEEVTGDRALQKVKDCFEKALEFLDDIDAWEVEYDASGGLPGLSVPIKAYVDIIGEHKKHGPVILDWKTGKNKPKNSMQLFTYRALLAGGPFSSAITGLWAMLDPNASVARPIDLSKVDPAFIGQQYQEVVDAINRQEFMSKVQKEKVEGKRGLPYGCKMCFQAPNCLDYSGLNARTNYYNGNVS